MFDHREARDLPLEQFARTADQCAVCFERLDQRHQAANVVGSGIAQLFQRLAGDHCAHAIAREQLAQQRAVLVVAEQVYAPDAGATGPRRARKVALEIG